jgi:hypothetical protein
MMNSAGMPWKQDADRIKNRLAATTQTWILFDCFSHQGDDKNRGWVFDQLDNRFRNRANKNPGKRL